jgi:hypothetical protein
MLLRRISLRNNIVISEHNRTRGVRFYWSNPTHSTKALFKLTTIDIQQDRSSQLRANHINFI